MMLRQCMIAHTYSSTTVPNHRPPPRINTNINGGVTMVIIHQLINYNNVLMGGGEARHY